MKRRLPSKATIIRTVILGISILNSALSLAGKSPLPIEDDTVAEAVSFLFTTGAALTAWWKNNSFTQGAIEADETFK